MGCVARHSHEVLVFAVLAHQLLGFLSYGTVFVNALVSGPELNQVFVSTVFTEPRHETR